MTDQRNKATQTPSKKRRAAVLATLLAQLNRSPELAKILILLLVWGHVRSRPGYTTFEAQSTPKPKVSRSISKGKGFNVKRPRERFL